VTNFASVVGCVCFFSDFPWFLGYASQWEGNPESGEVGFGRMSRFSGSR